MIRMEGDKVIEMTKEEIEAIQGFAPEEFGNAKPDLSARQFWLAALEIGVTKSSLLADIASRYEDASEREYLSIEVNEATTFSRSNVLVAELSEMYSISSEQLDALWDRANSI